MIFTDYLNKNILRELPLHRNHYSLLKNTAQFEDTAPTLENGIKEIEEFEKTVERPKLLRNLTIGSLTQLLGFSGLFSTITGGAEAYINLFSQGAVGAAPIWELIFSLSAFEFLTALIFPLSAFAFLTGLAALYTGYIRAERYSEINFKVVQEPIREAILEAVLALSIKSSRGDVLKMPASKRLTEATDSRVRFKYKIDELPEDQDGTK